MDLEKEYTFKYKEKDWQGKAIHIAALDTENGPAHLSKLLRDPLDPTVRGRCDAFEPATTTKQVTLVAKLEVIHLAAGAGNVDVINALFEYVKDHHVDKARGGEDADFEVAGREEIKRLLLDKKTKHDDADHYCAIHDAIFLGHVGAVKLLIELGADVNATNMHGQTPMHLCARGPRLKADVSSTWEAADILKRSGADLDLEDKAQHTPLMEAIRSNIDVKKLKLFTKPCFKDLEDAVKVDPSCALELLKDKEAWFKALTDKDLAKKNKYTLPCEEQLARLIANAPAVAGEVLDVLTRPPKVENKWNHPLPMHAKSSIIAGRAIMYTTEATWKGYSRRDEDTGIGKKFRWMIDKDINRSRSIREDRKGHERQKQRPKFLKLFQKSQEDMVRVKMLVLNFRNVVSVNVLQALAEVDDKDLAIFSKQSVQAVLDFVWGEAVMMEYTMDVVLRGLELVALFVAAVYPPEGNVVQSSWVALWSFVTTVASRDLVLEIGQIFGYLSHLHSLEPYLGSSRNYVDWLNIAVHNFLMWSLPMMDEGWHDRGGRKLLAFICCLRWVQLLLKIGAYKFNKMGYKIVCIFNSFFSIGSIFFITMFLFMAFAHAFAALDTPGANNSNTVIINAIRLLFLGDGDGIDFVLAFGSDEHAEWETWVSSAILFGSTVVFCICVLNLFIAVHSESYNKVVEQAEEHFYKRRVSICLERIVQPKFGLGFVLHPLRIYFLIVGAGIVLWSLSLYIHWMPHYITVLCLLLVLGLGDLVLRQSHRSKGMPDFSWPTSTDLAYIVRQGGAAVHPYLPQGEGNGQDAAALRACPEAEHGDEVSSAESVVSTKSAATLRREQEEKPGDHYIIWCQESDNEIESREDRGGHAEKLEELDKKFESKLQHIDRRMVSMEKNIQTLVKQLCPSQPVATTATMRSADVGTSRRGSPESSPAQRPGETSPGFAHGGMSPGFAPGHRVHSGASLSSTRSHGMQAIAERDVGDVHLAGAVLSAHQNTPKVTTDGGDMILHIHHQVKIRGAASSSAEVPLSLTPSGWQGALAAQSAIAAQSAVGPTSPGPTSLAALAASPPRSSRWGPNSESGLLLS